MSEAAPRKGLALPLIVSTTKVDESVPEAREINFRSPRFEENPFALQPSCFTIERFTIEG